MTHGRSVMNRQRWGPRRGVYIVDGIASADISSHIPRVKHVVAFARAFNAVRDRMLLLKIAKFFEAFSDVSLADKMMMAQSLEADLEYHRKVGEHILELLERVDSKRKSAVVWNRLFGGVCRLIFDRWTAQPGCRTATPHCF
jgi:hypothetical protein